MTYSGPLAPTTTLLSYSTSKYKKAFHLETKRTTITIDIYMDDNNLLYLRLPNSLKLEDKSWHHVCIIWYQTLPIPMTGFYFDGTHVLTSRAFRADKGLKGGGTLVLGARRDGSGEFVERLNGSMSNLKIWNRELTAQEISKVHGSCDFTRGNVFNWCENVIAPMLRKGVKIVSPSTTCISSLHGESTFTRQENFKLVGHVVTQKSVRDEFTCALLCLRSCNCQSFNLFKQDEDQFLCELSSATGKQHQADLILTQDKDVTYHAMLYD
ncbi:Pentraxin-4 [Stylophora pistillata]|uniref:Pentraxin-4 n=2 Tax=Stylophora pistillata TaxID=50429 RepID=A0A2B4SUD0_STYPI|nr:Pentraxin-4 [Stylophora pistillata]